MSYYFEISDVAEFEMFLDSHIRAYNNIKSKMLEAFEKNEDAHFFSWNGTSIQVAVAKSKIAEGWKMLIEQARKEGKEDSHVLNLVEQACLNRMRSYSSTRPDSRSTSPSANIAEDSAHLMFLETFDLIQQGKKK